MSEVAVGAKASVLHVVAAHDTALALGSGDLPVLATPRLVAWLEAAAVAAVASSVDKGNTTVGSHIAIDHLAPSKLEAQVTAEAVVTAVDGRRIEFEVLATEDGKPIGRGVHVRYVVDRKRFMG